MKATKISITIFMAFAMLFAQTGFVLAAPALQDATITGTVTALACGANSENPTVLVTLDNLQIVEVDLETAVILELIAPDTDCSPEALVDAIGTDIIIDPATLIPADEEPQHPVGAALSAFFSDIADYDKIMSAHEDGTGFGVLAQALWLVSKLEGDTDTFLAIVQAKKDKDFSAFTLADGSTPQNWGQFRKAVLNGDKKANLGVVMSDKNKQDKNNNGKGQDKEKTNNGKGQDKEKNK